MGDQGTYANSTWYQRLIQGSASRITRYREYDLMDNDVEIARSLDTIAGEMVGSDPNDDLPLELVIEQDKEQYVPPNVVTSLKAALRYWGDLHAWGTRLFRLARVTAKYGDCFFIRKSDTKRWEYVHPKNIVAAIVDERDVTVVLGWQIRMDYKAPNTTYGIPSGMYGNNAADQNVETFPADDVVWFSFSDDMSDAAPFGESVLRAVYRAQKQKELLEDAIIIYRIQRAPERRAFYIDVGKVPPNRVKSILEQFKNEIRQRKIPTHGGGVDQVDAVYNPMTMTEDFFFASRPDGRGSRVEPLPAGQGLGELSDLEYFQWKVFRGLGIPLSYMSEGQDGSIINDGKTGVAYIQELRFAMYIKRLQGYLTRVLDKEFKRYLKAVGIIIDPSIFHISLKEPENFGVYRQQQLNSDLLNTYSSASGIQFLSPRFALKKYLQLTDEEIIENEAKRREELGLDPNGGIKDLPLIYNAAPPGDPMAGGMGGGMVAGMGGDPFGGMGGDPFGGPGEMGATDGMGMPADNAGGEPPPQ